MPILQHKKNRPTLTIFFSVGLQIRLHGKGRRFPPGDHPISLHHHRRRRPSGHLATEQRVTELVQWCYRSIPSSRTDAGVKLTPFQRICVKIHPIPEETFSLPSSPRIVTRRDIVGPLRLKEFCENIPSLRKKKELIDRRCSHIFKCRNGISFHAQKS